MFLLRKITITVDISIHALLAESDSGRAETAITPLRFLSTLSLRRATGFITRSQLPTTFLSTLSLRRATGRHRGNDRCPVHFYPRSPCGERPTNTHREQQGQHISIHALLAESDKSTRQVKQTYRISIHALLAESDRRHRGNDRRPIHFYPRSPCGERPSDRLQFIRYIIKFLSTLSLRRATRQIAIHTIHNKISIHALLAESDYSNSLLTNVVFNFYPRSPCGERQIPNQRKIDQKNFYPRSPCGERRKHS